MERVAIVGSSGYIGSYLVRGLESSVLVHGYDLCANPTTQHVVRGRDADFSAYDAVVFLGGLTGRASCAKESWEAIYRENVEEVLAIGGKLRPDQLLVYASTAGVLEGACSGPAGEDWPVREGALDGYTRSMWIRERSVRALGCSTVGLRFGTVIGVSPTQRWDLVHVAMVRSAFLQGRVEVQNPGCRRAILCMRDLLTSVRAVLLRSSSSASGHAVYNLASFNATIGEIAEQVSSRASVPCVVTRRDEGESMMGFMASSIAFSTEYGVLFEGTNASLVDDLVEHFGKCLKTGTGRCRVCGGVDMRLVLDLCSQPLANNFVSQPCAQASYPLRVVRCAACTHTQLDYTVDPEVLFREYQYASGTSATLRAYFRELAEEIARDVGRSGRVLELACNDGSQLDEFARLGWETYGVDPACNLAEVARSKGHRVFCEFWGSGSSQWKDRLPPALDAIVAQNVVAHVPDPVAFLRACAEAMDPTTRLYVQTSQCDMYRNGEFDTIYHEHLSYFTVASMLRAAELAGLSVAEVAKKPIHGTSYLFKMRKAPAGGLSKLFRVGVHGVQALSAAQEERSIGMYEDSFYERYRGKAEGIKAWVQDKMAECASRGLRVVAYGAAAKGMTMLNYVFCNDASEHIQYIVDDAPMKQGKYTPGTNVAVRPTSDLASERGDLVVLVLAWNFVDEIVGNVRRLRGQITGNLRGTTYIMKAFPEPAFYELV